MNPWVATLVLWLHVASGVLWIGLLYYFNFVQMPTMPKIPDEQKPAISKHIAPAALFWFRWAALSTLIFGFAFAGMAGYTLQALALGLTSGVARDAMIGVGMWLGMIMAFNVWFVIWPNQQRALGLVETTPEAKKASARTAMLFSRTNTALSLPMLFAMVGARYFY